MNSFLKRIKHTIILTLLLNSILLAQQQGQYIRKSVSSIPVWIKPEALMNEIKNVRITEKYKELDITISEFMNNESYKRLCKYSLQLYGKSKQSKIDDIVIVPLGKQIQYFELVNLENFFSKFSVILCSVIQLSFLI